MQTLTFSNPSGRQGLILIPSPEGWMPRIWRTTIPASRWPTQLGISYKSVVAVFKERNHSRQNRVHRRGNGLPNHIYLYKAEVTDTEVENYCADSRCEEMTGQLPLCGDPESRDVK